MAPKVAKLPLRILLSNDDGIHAPGLKALENIDRHIVGPLHEYMQSLGDYRLLVCPDHPTFLRTKTHSHGYVPFAMCGSDILADTATTYDEPTAAASAICLDRGCELLPLLFQGT